MDLEYETGAGGDRVVPAAARVAKRSRAGCRGTLADGDHADSEGQAADASPGEELTPAERPRLR